MPDDIWITLDSSGPGGIETHVLILAKSLRERGLNVTVMFVADHGPHPTKKALATAGITVRHAGGLNVLRTLIASERPSLVHTHGYKAGIGARIICKMYRVPCVSTYHAGEPGNLKIKAYQSIDRFTAPLSHNIAVSEQIVAQLPSSARQIDNFVPLPKTFTSKRPRTIAFVGRLSEEKGADTFCELARDLPAIAFDIYGDGPMRLALEANAPSNVTFHGMKSGMDDLWQSIGLLCMPSRFEGLPMAALEAMSHGVPVACFGVGGLPGLISDRENGFLANPGDEEALMNRLLLWWCMKETERATIGAEARRTIEARYSTRVLLPNVLDVYRTARRGMALDSTQAEAVDHAT